MKLLDVVVQLRRVPLHLVRLLVPGDLARFTWFRRLYGGRWELWLLGRGANFAVLMWLCEEADPRNWHRLQAKDSKARRVTVEEWSQ